MTRWSAICAAVSIGIAVVMLWPLLTWPYLGWAWDYQLYMWHAERWLNGGAFYLPWQTTGPYTAGLADSMFPPVILWLLVPFSLLPPAVSAILWWSIPLAIVASVVRNLRPAPVTWPFIALAAAWPGAAVKVVVGSPSIWLLAALAIGVVKAGPAVFVLVKPSLAPFALWGAWRRSWWLWLAALVVLCLPFGAMWGDWMVAMRNAVNATPLYSFREAPLFLVPLIAWAGSPNRAPLPRFAVRRLARAQT